MAARSKIKIESSPYQKRYTRITETNAEAEDREKKQQDFSEKEQEKIYQILCGRFPKNEKLHMAKISKYLIERGFSPKSYGYSKMKNLLQEMTQYLEMEDVVIHGVPNVLILLRDKPVKKEIKPLAVIKEAKPPMVITKEKKEEKGPMIDKSERETVKQEKQVDFASLTYMPPKILDILRRKGIHEPEKMLAKAYQESLEKNTVQTRSYSITFPIQGMGEEGWLAILKKNEYPRGRQWYLSYVGSPRKEQEVEEEDREEDHPIPPGKSLEQFADLGYWQEFLKELAELALPEKWDGSNRRYGRYYILKKYIQYTFYRLQQENKVCISNDQKFAAFNTGLVNNRYDDIYACFVPNPQHGKEPWKFEAFAIAGIKGKDGYGKMLTNYFDPLPQVPTYVENNEDLIYDLSKDLITDYEHIIIDNLNRLPLGYLKEGCYGDETALRLIGKLEERGLDYDCRKQISTELSGYIAENDKIYRRLRSRMEDAIEIALKRVRWNFRTAIPCYFPKGNCMSLMLPLCMEDDRRTDAALVVQKNLSGSYQGQTILRLDQAYLDARLICRPNIEWLQPERERTERREILQKY